MNKIFVCLLVAVFSVPAFASRARLLVIGTGDAGQLLDGYGNGGSFITEDAYNAFYNPAYVNHFTNRVILEKSGGLMLTEGGASGEQTGAEGGFTTAVGSDLNLGVYFNRETPLDSWLQTTAVKMHPIDVTIGGTGRINWGVGLTYAAAHSGSDSNTNLDARLGVIYDNFEPFVDYKIIGDENIGGNSQKHKDWMAGLRYRGSQWNPYLSVRQTELGGNTTRKAWGAGVMRSLVLDDGVRFQYGVAVIRRSNSQVLGMNSISYPDIVRTVVPLNFTLEGDVLHWLTLRGGFTYNFWDRSQQNTLTDQTAGRFGASVHLGKATLDWAVGSTAGGENLDGQTLDFASGFFTAASLAYAW